MIDKQIFDRITTFKLFSNCGNPVPANIKFDILQVSTWEEAKRNYSDSVWEDTTLEARNELTSFLHSKYMNDYRDWNKVTDEGKAFLESTIKPILIDVKDANGLDKVFVDSVMWDLLGAIIEFYYGKCKNRPEFFLDLLKVYESGNFPCGWIGEWPKGKLVIF